MKKFELILVKVFTSMLAGIAAIVIATIMTVLCVPLIIADMFRGHSLMHELKTYAFGLKEVIFDELFGGLKTLLEEFNEEDSAE